MQRSRVSYSTFWVGPPFTNEDLQPPVTLEKSPRVLKKCGTVPSITCPSSTWQPPVEARLVLGLSCVTIYTINHAQRLRTVLARTGPSGQAANMAGPPASEPRRALELVRALRSGSFNYSLSRTLSEVAMECLYGLLVPRVTIVKRCDIIVVPVPSVAPRRGGRGVENQHCDHQFAWNP